MSRPKGSKNKPKISETTPHEEYHKTAMQDTTFGNAHADAVIIGHEHKETNESGGIAINDDWKITSDSPNVILMHRQSKTHRRSKPSSPDNWERFYYSNVANALQALVNKEIMGTGLKDLQMVVDKIDQLSVDIKKAVGGLARIP